MSGQTPTPTPNTASGNNNNNTNQPTSMSSQPQLSNPTTSTPTLVQPPTSQPDLTETIKLSEISDPNLRAFIAKRDPVAQKKLIEMAMKGDEVLRLENEKKKKEEEELKEKVSKEREPFEKMIKTDPYLMKLFQEGSSVMEKGDNPLSNPEFAVMTRCYNAFHESERLFNEQNQALKKMKQEDNSFFTQWDRDNNNNNNGGARVLNSGNANSNSNNGNTNNGGVSGSGAYADTPFWGNFGI